MVKKRKKERKTVRINLLVKKEIRDWVKDYAAIRGTSVSTLITAHLYELRDKEEGKHVEQL